MRTRARVIASLTLAAFCACGRGHYAVPTNATDTQEREIKTDSLTFRAAMLVGNQSPRIVRAEITVLNTGERPIALLVPGGCPVAFQLFKTPPSEGRQVWDSRRARSSMGCALSLVPASIDPGHSQVFGREDEIADVLGDSLPAARYYVRSLLRLDQDSITLYAGEVTLSK